VAGNSETDARNSSTQVASTSLRADATESALCGYLSLIALAGLLANAIFDVPLADPIATLALVPLIAKEGGEQSMLRDTAVPDPGILPLRLPTSRSIKPSLTGRAARAMPASYFLFRKNLVGTPCIRFGNNIREHATTGIGSYGASMVSSAPKVSRHGSGFQTANSGI
jgi:hypothetical protein